MAMAHDTDVESEVPDFVQRPPYCRIDPRLFVAEGAATQSGEKHRAREALARGNETARTRVFDIVRGYAWPGAYTGRALRNRFMERWDGRERDLAAALETERAAYQVRA